MLTGLTHWAAQWLPVPVWTAYFLDLLVSFLVITFLFALIFKLLPDVTVSWKDVWIGAVFTGVLFIIGKFLIGVYMGQPEHRFRLRCSRFAGGRARVDLLLANPLFWR
jgi:membrane protein